MQRFFKGEEAYALPEAAKPGGHLFEEALDNLIKAKSGGSDSSAEPAILRAQFSRALERFSAGAWKDAVDVKRGTCVTAHTVDTTLWNIFCGLRQLTAVICDYPGLRILEATKTAKKTLSADVEGSNLLSLLSRSDDARVLRRAIFKCQRDFEDGVVEPSDEAAIPNFAVYSTGIMKTCGADDNTFEASVTVAHMPAQPRLGKSCAIIVILDIPCAELSLPGASSDPPGVGDEDVYCEQTAMMNLGDSASNVG